MDMTDVQAVIESRRRALDTRAFLAALDESSSIDDLRVIARQLSFYVFAFQDMLRLTHERISDPELRDIAERLRGEDAGHELWFVHDMNQLGCALDLLWTFGPEHRGTRDATYGLLAELLRADDDRVRLTFPLVLEAAGSVFFRRVVGLIRRAGYNEPLRYFARSHQEVEAEHDIFSEEGQQGLARVVFDESSFASALALVHRSFDCFERLADALEHHRASARC